MKVDFEGARIKIRRKEGVVLVIDIYLDLFKIVKNQARIMMDIPFRIGALSQDKEINENAIQNLGQIIRNRGRFITPLIEGFFKQLADKECDLILLHSGRIYDLDDYEAELSSKFGRILPKDVIENQNLTDAEWGTLLESEMFNFSIGDIELSINSAVPLEWDSNFVVSLDTSKRQFILKKSTSTNDKKMDIYLGIRGMTKEADVEVKVKDLIYSGKVKNNTNFIAPEWKHLSSDDEQIFQIYLKEYKKKKFNMNCPECKTDHEFKKPFYCDKKSSGRIFSRGTVILKGISSCQKGFVLFRIDGNKIKYLTSEKEGLEFEDLRFIFVLNKQVYGVTCRDKSLEIKEGVEIHPNLYELGKYDIVYLL